MLGSNVTGTNTAFWLPDYATTLSWARVQTTHPHGTLTTESPHPAETPQLLQKTHTPLLDLTAPAESSHTRRDPTPHGDSTLPAEAPPTAANTRLITTASLSHCPCLKRHPPWPSLSCEAH